MAPDVVSRIFEAVLHPPRTSARALAWACRMVLRLRRRPAIRRRRITVVTAPGEGGRRFQIALPAIAPPSARPRLPPAPPSEEATGSEHILVAEDDRVGARPLAVDTLESLGYRVTTARNAASALRRPLRDGARRSRCCSLT
ncbi:hypothetical protein ACRAWD_28885 [Caulobacter segnis]